MGDDPVIPYTLNAWDCPACGNQNTTDADLGRAETCDACGEEFEIQS